MKIKIILLQLLSLCLLSGCVGLDLGGTDNVPAIGSAKLVTGERKVLGGEVKILNKVGIGAGVWIFKPKS
mgnify:FL=1|tara:strand:+ start:1306 stop:1515 length:210 start_codon:yes stop_codon:yes gene_type:complete